MSQPTTAQNLADQALYIITTTPGLAAAAGTLSRESLHDAIVDAGLTGDRLTVAQVRELLPTVSRLPGDVLELEGREGWWIVTGMDGSAVHMAVRTISTAGGPNGRDVLTARPALVPANAHPANGTHTPSGRSVMRWVLHTLITERYTHSSDSDPAAASLAAAVLSARNVGAALQG